MHSDVQYSPVVEGLSHVAIRTRDILESVRYYTEILWLPASIWNCFPAAAGKE